MNFYCIFRQIKFAEKMQLIKDLESDTLKFHKEAKNPTRYILLNDEGISEDIHETWGVFSSLQDAILNYLILWNTRYSKNEFNKYNESKWTYATNDEYIFLRRGLHIIEMKDGIRRTDELQMFITYSIIDGSLYKYECLEPHQHYNLKTLKEYTKLEEFDEFPPLRDFDKSILNLRN